jgi:integrase
MGLIPKLKAALAEQSCLPNTVSTYCFWARKFYGFIRKPASQWTGSATDESVAKQMRAAVRSAGIVKRVPPHTLRHAFATHAMQSGNDIETVRQLMGHETLETTAIYLHSHAAQGRSPMDCAAPVDVSEGSGFGGLLE